MRLAVVGTGLMGASVGLAAKQAGADHVAGYDGDPEALRVAVERGAVDEPADSMESAVAEADLVVVAVPVAIDPQAHDRLVALTSHLPHALANVLVNQAGAGRIEGHDPLAAAGGSLRDMTRVAGANPRIWVDIFLDNAAALGEAL